MEEFELDLLESVEQVEASVTEREANRTKAKEIK